MKLKFVISVLALAFCVAVLPVHAQYMPVVFDKVYGDGGNIIRISQTADGDVVMASNEKERIRISWLDRTGSITVSRPLPGYTTVNCLIPLGEGRVLVAGQSGVRRNRIRDNVSLCGRASIISRDGTLIRDIYVGGQGSSLLQVQLLADESLVMGGYEMRSSGTKRGLILKANAQGKELFRYVPSEGDVCTAFEVMGNAGEYIYAAFTSEGKTGWASVVRLDGSGKAYYATKLPAEDYRIKSVAVDITDGSVIVAGNSSFEGGVLYKIRPEGDIVFGRRIVPAAPETTLSHLFVSRSGNILTGGDNGEQGFYTLLRPDGTPLLSRTAPGSICGMDMNPVSGEAVITSYAGQGGTFVRINAAGRSEFECALNGRFDKIRVDNVGDALLASSREGRVSMISVIGDRLFDRYVSGDSPALYDEVLLASSGEVMFMGMNNRLVKLGHGLFISDAKITKPINGFATALFTITLTGYATTKEGTPIPVTVDYETREGTATMANNFKSVAGKLSFIPTGGANRYLVKQEIEVPVKANDLIEGSKEFSLLLSDVRQSYLIKPEGKGVIEDQQAVIKLVATTDGLEGMKDIGYELGLFKTDGTALTNATGTNIVVNGVYGKGSADALDFDMGRTPHVIFANGSHTASFNARTLSNTRYELPKTVVVNFNEVYALSSSNVGFEGIQLNCQGTVVDQPAMVSISSLGDHRINNNTVSGFFRVELRRVSDGALLVNTTGSDIVIGCKTVDGSAQEGTDFVFTNQHNLRIGGTGDYSAVNLNGIVLYNENMDTKTLKVVLDNVISPNGAQPIAISTTEKTSEFTIRH